MPRYVALLRAINVGGHVVKMDRLKAVFEEMRLGNVETFIASGNVLFDTTSKDIPALEKKIEARLEKALGYEVDTFIRPLDAMADIATSHPFGASIAEGHTLSVGFLKEPAAIAMQKALAALNNPGDEFHCNDREVYWMCRGRTSDSAIGGTPLKKALAATNTFRNVTTIQRLAAKAKR